jgi:hypothetical protein
MRGRILFLEGSRARADAANSASEAAPRSGKDKLTMLGFLIGTVCLIGLVKVVRRSRYGGFGYGPGYGHSYGHFGHFGDPWGHGGHGGGCGHRGRHAYGRGGWGSGYREDAEFGYDEREDARGGEWEGGRFGGFFALHGLFARLDATPGQEKAIKAAFEELRTKARALKEDARGMRGDLASALRGESLDADTLGTVASRATGAVDGLRDAMIGAVLKVHEVLDERQRGIAADLLESGPRFGRGWRGRGAPYRGARA